MSIVAAIVKARRYGVVHCGFSSRSAPSLAELAVEFGLDPDSANYTEIDTEGAQRVAELILAQDLAYDAQIMPPAQAGQFARQFLAEFGEEGARFFTNGTFHQVRDSKWSGASWNPVTAATFDTGVLALGTVRAGCLWVEDED